MDYTQPHYLPRRLSDHTPLLIQFSSPARPQARFQFCDMWNKHKEFCQIIASIPSPSASLPKLQQLKNYLDKLRPKLMKLNRHHFADLRVWVFIGPGPDRTGWTEDWKLANSWTGPIWSRSWTGPDRSEPGPDRLQTGPTPDQSSDIEQQLSASDVPLSLHLSLYIDYPFWFNQ